MLRLALAFALSPAVAGTAAFAGDMVSTYEASMGRVWTDPDGYTLYTYDKDTRGSPTAACAARCLQVWPPLLAPPGSRPTGRWSLSRADFGDGRVAQIWAFDGLPLYRWVKDARPGDATGDGVGGVWHVALVPADADVQASVAVLPAPAAPPASVPNPPPQAQSEGG